MCPLHRIITLMAALSHMIFKSDVSHMDVNWVNYFCPDSLARKMQSYKGCNEPVTSFIRQGDLRHRDTRVSMRSVFMALDNSSTEQCSRQFENTI